METIYITRDFNPLANCILHEGDCLDSLSQMPNGFAKLVVTSPPYNLGKPGPFQVLGIRFLNSPIPCKVRDSG